jgi:thiamine biosynthesis protein ThiS
MRITLKLYASLADYLPPEARKGNQLPLELRENTTIADVLSQQLLPPQLCHLVLVNGVFIPPRERATHPLQQNDEVAIWPPVAGG